MAARVGLVQQRAGTHTNPDAPKDIEQLSDPDFIPDGSSTVYIIFMIIGIVGYFTIPTVASWIVSAGGTSAYNRNVARAGSIAGAAVGAASGKVTGKLLK